MGMGMSLVVWTGYSNDKRSCVLRLCGSIELGLNEIRSDVHQIEWKKDNAQYGGYRDDEGCVFKQWHTVQRLGS